MKTNKPHGTLYVGVTADLASRVFQHRGGVGSIFCKKYNLTRLFCAEEAATIDDAIAREKAIKEWPRLWKLQLVHALNPNWDDLYETLDN